MTLHEFDKAVNFLGAKLMTLAPHLRWTCERTDYDHAAKWCGHLHSGGERESIVFGVYAWSWDGAMDEAILRDSLAKPLRGSMHFLSDPVRPDRR